MKGIHGLMRSLIYGVWFIEPQIARNYAPQVLAILNREKIDFEYEEPSKAVTVRSYYDDDDDIDGDGYEEGSTEGIADITQPDSVVVIPIHGVIMKEDSWCDIGMITRANQLKQCFDNPNVVGVVFDIDTPGGESAACEIMTNALSKRNKPVIGFVSGYMCSAGVFMFSGCDTIVSGQKSNFIGSVGTMCSFPDVRGWKEYEGIKWHEIYATKSTNKNIESREAVKGNYEPMRENILDPLNQLFINHVKQTRPNVSEEALTGKVFLTEAAKEHGLIDSEGDLNFAINQVSMFKNKFKALEKFENKKELTPADLNEIQSVLNKYGIGATVAIPKPASMLLETEGEDGNIYVYAEDGEDPVGKRCVKADPEGNPTEENLTDGEHSLADGRTLTSSTNEEDGYSYVDSVTEAEEKETEEKEEEKKPEQKVTFTAEEAAALVDQKLEEFKSTLSLGTTPPKKGNFNNKKVEEEYKPSVMERKMREIQERNKKK